MRRPFGLLLAAAMVSAPLLSPHAFAQESPAPGQQADPATQTQTQPSTPDAQPTGQQGTQSDGQQPAATTGQQEQAPQKLTFKGDIVLWAFTVRPDKTADYEQVLGKLRESLAKLGRQQQAAGWKVIKNTEPQPDGNILYIHVIDPVVQGADYSVTNIVYEAFPDPEERIAFYELYRGSINAAFFNIQAPVIADMSRAGAQSQPASQPAAPAQPQSPSPAQPQTDPSTQPQSPSPAQPQ